MKFTSVFIFFAVVQFLCFIEPWANAGSPSVAADTVAPEMPEETIIKSVEVHQPSEPRVEILTPHENESFTWGSQVRYAIAVADAVDGASKYGEITATECLLEIEYLPATIATDVKAIVAKAASRPEPPGLSRMKMSTCFGCHADKITLAGPSFAEIAQRYGNQTGSSRLLGKRIIEGSSGVWGASEMPSHPDITTEAAEQIATYILEQGAKKNSWIYPGFEGTFRIIDKPATDAKGVYRLTASYTSKAQRRGQHSVVFKVE
ncbi:Cytochrome c551/c552 [Chryseolinea serpens]|uniref:Cytochrome c551/c552 n=1 Tax=Chryseolinea serpens TaxID=947013 RepID=A0A1M5JZ06_9BACT|nr:c-type cytochrome [Chryseolinea serpens]SHG45263.1 Cytochrome c551/c552 [Chryseolinea serpens]